MIKKKYYLFFSFPEYLLVKNLILFLMRNLLLFVLDGNVSPSPSHRWAMVLPMTDYRIGYVYTTCFTIYEFKIMNSPLHSYDSGYTFVIQLTRIENWIN